MVEYNENDISSFDFILKLKKDSNHRWYNSYEILVNWIV